VAIVSTIRSQRFNLNRFGEDGAHDAVRAEALRWIFAAV
jgi:hypothetical protein